jgi:translation initiation factor IF-3
MPTKKALELAREAQLDLVEVAKNSTPPVAKILNFSKMRYEQDVKRRESRKHQQSAQMKEVRFRLKVDQNDFRIKIERMAKFLKQGDKVKAQIMFRGRENQYPQLGVDMLDKVAEEVSEFGIVTNAPTHEGRNVTMIMSPVGKKVQTISEQHRRGAEAKERRAARQRARLAAKGLGKDGRSLENKEVDKELEKNNEKKGNQNA